MRFTSFTALAAIAALCILPHLAAALDQISRRGKYLVNPAGQRFSIKGVAYQESVATEVAEGTTYPEPTSFVDPLALSDACRRDVPNLRNLGVNVARVFSVNASLNHDDCMREFSQANIYVILDMALPGNASINRADPVWDTSLLQQFTSVVDAFAKYDNVLAYNVANEVVTANNNTDALPFVRAAVRDVKAYLRGRNLNTLVTYTSADGPDGAQGRRLLQARYLTCGDEADTVDLYGLNSYAWCGDSNYQASGYATLAQDFGSLPVPAYLSEFGCAQGGSANRPWTEVAAIYSPPFSDVFSGGAAFQYFPLNASAGGLDYGLTDINNGQVTLRADWDRLRAQFANATTPGIPSPLPATSSDCPAQSEVLLASSQLPPTPNAALCACMQANVWECQPRPATVNDLPLLGETVGAACSLLDQNDAPVSCSAALDGNGATGTYGNWSQCNAQQRLSWAMSEYYGLFRNSSDSCSFSNNAALVPSISASAVQDGSAQAQCISSNGGAVARVFDPPPTGSSSGGGAGGGGSGGSSSGSGNDNSGAIMHLHPVYILASACAALALASAI
ncbi:glycoside hydrolase family 72 protein [Ceraceosorus bombacis]|uniref:1,3-beta-glucanosyltransferase n=1 Tax=Ceraceosorus bombacis TaxID=401625 RepID=A0A0P1BEL1_9BASI|nr:glycoside hydrolase family 72 protein [Ceraceosorus bombacis]